MTNVYVKPNHSVAHPLLISYFFPLIVIYLLTLSTADEIAVSNDSCKNRVEKVYFFGHNLQMLLFHSSHSYAFGSNNKRILLYSAITHIILIDY